MKTTRVPCGSEVDASRASGSRSLAAGLLPMVAMLAGLLWMAALPMALYGQSGSLAELRERAVAAGIDESRVSELVERGSARQIGEVELAELMRPAVEMAEQGLPGELVIQKALEGMAKGVPPSRLNGVLAQIRQGAEQSVPAVDRWMERPDVGQMLERSGSGGEQERSRFRRDMLRVGARAGLGASEGAPVDDILAALSDPGVMQRASPEQIVAAATVMGDLPAATGLGLPDASRIVARAVRNGFSSNDLQRLPAAMNMAQRRSQLPAASVVEGVGEQMDRGIPASDILQNLFNGEVGGGGPPGHTPPGLENRPDRDENHPGRGVSGPPGQELPTTPPGQDGTPPGLDGETPGNGGGPPTTPPGQGSDGPPSSPPGQDGTPPGQGPDSPGNGGGPPTTPPGQGSDGPPSSPPGQALDTPGNGRGPGR